MTDIRRRDFIFGTALALLSRGPADAGVIEGALPWQPNAGSPPKPAKAGGWEFFTPAEAAAVESLADRIIPPDPQTPGGKDAGCAVFLDRQLAGPYGRDEGLYNRGPFQQGTKTQGPQSALNRAEVYRAALAALESYARSHDHVAWVQLDVERQDEILQGIERGQIDLESVDGKTFFKDLVQDIQAGFFADPLYGGNRDMCAWKMIGFPGAHYDFSEWVDRHNQRYPHPPVSIQGRREWIPKT